MGKLIFVIDQKVLLNWGGGGGALHCVNPVLISANTDKQFNQKTTRYAFLL